MQGARETLWIAAMLALSACTAAPVANDSAERGNDASPAPVAEKIATRCAAAGISVEQDRKGLNVRAEPDAKAKILGVLQSVEDPESHRWTGPPDYYGPGFRIVDMQGDWVQIDGADPISEGIGDDIPNYTGTGWVHSRAIAIDLQRPGDGVTGPARAAPDETAAVIDPDGAVNAHMVRQSLKLLDCRGEWLRVEYRHTARRDANGQWIDYTPAEIARSKPVQGWVRSYAFRTRQTCDSGALKCRSDGSVNWNATFGYE
jgi:hypothetical protein